MESLAAVAAAALVAASLAGTAALQGEKKPPASAGASAGVETKGDVIAGRKLYKAHCALCHFADAAILKVGPGMKGLFKQQKLPLSGLTLSEENVRQRIEEGNPDPQKPLMPAYRDILTAKEMDDLIAYLKTL